MKRKILSMVLVIGTSLFLLGCPDPVTDLPKSINADLAALTVSAGSLNPSFAAGTAAYTISVPHATTSITITGTAADANATVGGDSGVAKSLNVGANTITVTVTAQDGTTIKNYVVTVNRLSFALTMVNVPAGRFQRDTLMANTSLVSTAYSMSQQEITRTQFLDIMGIDPSNATSSSGGSDPVQMVNWYQAIAFCNKLSLAEGLAAVYSVNGISDWAALSYASIPSVNNATWNAATANWANNGYRLPTEMEWMWAAMGAPADGQGGGTNTTEYQKKYAGSTEGLGQTNIGNYAWYYTNSSNQTHPVGTKTANELGLFDMTGNVDEWCWDWSAAYPAGTLMDYRGAASGSYRVLRGGSWGHTAVTSTVASRHDSPPNNQNHLSGFRVVRN